MKRTREIKTSRTSPLEWKEHLVKAYQKLQELAEVYGILRTMRSLAALLVVVACCPIFVILKLGRDVWRKLLRKILQFKYPQAISCEEQASSTTISLVLCKGLRKAHELHRKLEEVATDRTLLQCKLCSFNSLGQFWLPMELHIDDHVVQLLPTWKHHLVSEQSIKEYATELCSQRLRADLPPWQVWLIPLKHDELDSFQFWVVIKSQSALHPMLYQTVTGQSESFPSKADLQATEDLHADERQPLPRAVTRLWSHMSARTMDWVLSTVAHVVYPHYKVIVTKTRPLMNGREIYRQSVEHVRNFGLYWYYATQKLSLQELLSEIKRTFIRGLVSLFQFCLNLCLIGLQWVFLAFGLIVSLTKSLRWSWQRITAVPTLVGSLITELSASDDPDIQLLKEQANIVREALQILWFGPQLTLDTVLHNFKLGRSPVVRDERATILSWSNPIPLGLLDGICTSSNTKLLDVLLTACSGALRELYKAHGDLCQPVEIAVPYSWCSRTPFSTDLELLAEESKASFEGDVTVVLPCDMDDLLWTLKKIKIQTKPFLHNETTLRVTRQCEQIIQSLPATSYLPTLKREALAMLSVTKSPSLTSTTWDIHYALQWPFSSNKFQLCASFSSTGLRLGILSDIPRPQLALVTSSFERQAYELAAMFGVQNRRLSPHSSPSASPKQTPPPTPRSFSRGRFVFPETLSTI